MNIKYLVLSIYQVILLVQYYRKKKKIKLVHLIKENDVIVITDEIYNLYVMMSITVLLNAMKLKIR